MKAEQIKVHEETELQRKAERNYFTRLESSILLQDILLHTQKLVYNEEDRRQRAQVDYQRATAISVLAQNGSYTEAVQLLDQIVFPSAKAKALRSFLKHLSHRCSGKQLTSEITLYEHLLETYLTIFWYGFDHSKEEASVLFELVEQVKSLGITSEKLLKEINNFYKHFSQSFGNMFNFDRVDGYDAFSQLLAAVPPQDEIFLTADILREWKKEEHLIVTDGHDAGVFKKTYDHICSLANFESIDELYTETHKSSTYLIKRLSLLALLTQAATLKHPLFEQIKEEVLSFLQKPAIWTNYEEHEKNALIRTVSALLNTTVHPDLVEDIINTVLKAEEEFGDHYRIYTYVYFAQTLNYHDHTKAHTALLKRLTEQVAAFYPSVRMQLLDSEFGLDSASYLAASIEQLTGVSSVNDFHEIISSITHIATQKKEKNKTFDAIEFSDRHTQIALQYLSQAGHPYEAWDIATKSLSSAAIVEFETWLFSTYFTSNTDSLPLLVALEDYAQKDTLHPYFRLKMLELLGKNPEVTTSMVLDYIKTHNHAFTEFLVFFVVKVIQSPTEKRQSLKVIRKTLKNPELNREEVHAFLQNVILFWDYEMISNELFKIIGHSQEMDYKTAIPPFPYTADVLATLIHAENDKAVGVAELLFANEAYSAHFPDQFQTLFDTLLNHGQWPLELKNTLLERSDTKLVAEIDSKYSRLQQFVITTYNTPLSIPILTALEPDPKTDPQTYEEMKTKLQEIFAGDDVVRPLPPQKFFLQLGLRGEELRNKVYLQEAGAYTYGYIGSLEESTFKNHLETTAALRVDPEQTQQFYTYLTENGHGPEQAQLIVDNLARGIHPLTGTGLQVTLTKEVDIVSDTDYEKNLIGQQIIEILSLRYNPAELLAKVGNDRREFSIVAICNTVEAVHKQRKDPFLLDEIRENWRKYFFSHVFPYMNEDMKLEIDILLEKYDHLYTKTKVKSKAKPLTISYIEKGNEPLRFMRAVDAVRCCVNTTQPDHIDYMSRRLVSPTAMTYDITDRDTGTIIGSIECRLAQNAKTQAFELCCLGMYSSYKTQALIDTAFSYIEETLARPLGCSAINISNKYGGTISQPRGYEKVGGTEDTQSSVTLHAFNEVLDPNGRPYIGMAIDDIGKLSGEFTFSGFRKKLK